LTNHQTALVVFNRQHAVLSADMLRSNHHQHWARLASLQESACWSHTEMATAKLVPLICSETTSCDH